MGTYVEEPREKNWHFCPACFMLNVACEAWKSIGALLKWFIALASMKVAPP